MFSCASALASSRATPVWCLLLTCRHIHDLRMLDSNPRYVLKTPQKHTVSKASAATLNRRNYGLVGTLQSYVFCWWPRRLNLASYVTTWMEEPALKLITESLMVNHAGTHSTL